MPSRIVLILLAVFAACGLFRTHEHVFQGLDCSALRLMAQSLSEGRPLKGQDTVLPSLDPALRPWTLLTPEVHRITRDRSWQLNNLDQAEDFPFFYPLLPMVAAGLDQLLPFNAIDLFVPLTGWLFLLSLMAFLYQRHGPGGSVWGLLVFAACSLPIWMWRGFYLEAPGLALLGSVLLLHLTLPVIRAPQALLMTTACGLAISFHPYLAVFAVPQAAYIIWRAETARATGLALLGFLLGCAPIVGFTAWVTAPYGPMFFHIFSFLPRPELTKGLLVAALAAGLVGYAFFAFRARTLPAEPSLRLRLCALLLLILAWGLPLLWPSLRQGTTWGLKDFLNATQWPLLLLLLLVTPYALLSKKDRPLGFLVFFALLLLPAFALLKGSDRMPMWSMRRLLPPLYLLLLGVAVFGPQLLLHLRSLRGGQWLGRIALLLGAGACAYIPSRWPDPYLVRFDHGADALVAEARTVLDNHWTLFEAYPHSVPFAVFPKNHAFAISMETPHHLPLLTDWLSHSDQLGERFIVTPHENPGLISNAALEPYWDRELPMARLFTRKALPAAAVEIPVRLNILRIQPLAPGDFHPLDRTFGASSLGLSGPWGRDDVGINQGRGKPRLTAAWTRQGSRFTGPVPTAGQPTRIIVQAAAQRNDRPDQVLVITLPWTDKALHLTFPKTLTTVEALLPPLPEGVGFPATGEYVLTSLYPYDPKVQGIRGFKKDLGVLLHRIQIDAVSSSARD